MNRYVTLNVRQGEQILLDIKASVGSNTPVRIVSGSTDETILVSYWSGNHSFYADADTMAIYGDVTGLECVDNGAKITGLDSEHNNLMGYIDCASCEIETLNLKNCTELASLYCDNDHISELFLGDCSGLQEPFCNNNNIAKLELNACTKLSELACNTNNISTLDVSACARLVFLACYQNPFSAAAIDQIYCDLPDCTNGQFIGYMIPLYNAEDLNYNTVLSTNANNATSKNWKVVYRNPDLAPIPPTTGNFDCITGFEELSLTKEAIQLAPNPAKDFVTILLCETYLEKPLEIIDIFGRIVYSDAAQIRQDISVADLPNGLYIVKVGDVTTKLIKR